MNDSSPVIDQVQDSIADTLNGLDKKIRDFQNMLIDRMNSSDVKQAGGVPDGERSKDSSDSISE